VSLKVFHILFIILATLLAALCAAWSFVNQIAIPFGIASIVVGVALILYGIWFVKKSRRIIT
jgi:hypothetical protein